MTVPDTPARSELIRSCVNVNGTERKARCLRNATQRRLSGSRVKRLNGGTQPGIIARLCLAELPSEELISVLQRAEGECV